MEATIQPAGDSPTYDPTWEQSRSLFFADGDYCHYLECLGLAARKTGCANQAHVLMTNHPHLLVTPLREYSSPEMMQSLGRRYVR